MDGMHLPVVLNTFISLDVIIKHIYFSAKIQLLSKSQGKQQLILSKSQGKHRCNGKDSIKYRDGGLLNGLVSDYHTFSILKC